MLYGPSRKSIDEVWTANELEKLLNGKWHVAPKSTLWFAETLSFGNFIVNDGRRVIFVANEQPNFLEMLRSSESQVSCVITSSPIDGLSDNIPQLIVEDTKVVLGIIAAEVRERFKGKVVAVTGGAGTSITTKLLHRLFVSDSQVVATKKNDDSQQGVCLTMAECKWNSDAEACLLEIDSSVFANNFDINNIIKPHICAIVGTDVDHEILPSVSDTEAAIINAKVCAGIVPGGFAVLNADMRNFDVVLSEVKKYGAKPIICGSKKGNYDSYLKASTFSGNSTNVGAVILGKEVIYKIPIIGKGKVQNSIIALTIMALLGVKDLEDAAKRLEGFVSKRTV